MAIEIYLGNPPENIKNWIKAEYDKKLTKVVYADGTTWEGIIENAWDIPNRENCKNVILGNTILEIHLAFQDNTSLESITIPNSVTFIDDREFINCTSLKEITLPNSVISIGDEAFWNCVSLKEITLPNSVTSIGNVAFFECTSLYSCKFSNNLSSIGSEAFAYTDLYEADLSNTKLIEIPHGLFDGCAPLNNVILPNTITHIGDNVFTYSNLSKIIIPNSVTSIGDEAFLNSSCYDITFEGKTKAEVEALAGDNLFGFLSDISYVDIIFHCTDGDIIVSQVEE